MAPAAPDSATLRASLAALPGLAEPPTERRGLATTASPAASFGSEAAPACPSEQAFALTGPASQELIFAAHTLARPLRTESVLSLGVVQPSLRPVCATEPYKKALTAKAAHRCLLVRLGRLQQALAALTGAEERRMALGKISEPVRRALLKHMEVQRLQQRSCPTQAASVARKQKLPSESTGRHVRSAARTSIAGAAPCSDAARIPWPRAKGNVHKKMGGFQARICLAPSLDAATRCYPTQEDAVAARLALRKAQERLALSVGTGAVALSAEAVELALDAACAEAQISLQDLGLSFCARVDAHSLVGVSVTGSYGTRLDQILHQRHRLLEGKATGWLAFRGAWVEVMCSATACRSWGDIRSRSKRKDAAERIAEKARVRQLTHKREMQGVAKVRQVDRAVTAVQRAMETCARAARRQRDGPKPLCARRGRAVDGVHCGVETCARASGHPHGGPKRLCTRRGIHPCRRSFPLALPPACVCQAAA